MSDLRINNITDRTGDSGPVIAGVSTVSSGQFVVPVGPTEYRGGRGRGVLGGSHPASSRMNMVEIATAANATDFGDLSTANYENAACASSTRGVWMGGTADNDVIDFVTISSGGGSIATWPAGMLVGCAPWTTGFNNSTRGGCMGGAQSPSGVRTNTIQYLTIASSGNTSDFGDLTFPSRRAGASNSPTRALYYGGTNSPASAVNTIQYITTATTGDAQEFGNMSTGKDIFAGCSGSTTRAIIGGGYDGSNINVIEYVTIATLGNSVDFGDLTTQRRGGGGCSSQVRAIFMGGYTPGGTIIDYITIAATGNATDFGDLTDGSKLSDAASDVNGGLG